MDGIDERQGDLDGHAAVRQAGPGGLVVGLDGGRVLSEGQLDANVGVGVAVGDVVDDLADGPAAFAVGGVELGVVEPGNGLAKTGGQLAEGFDLVGARAFRGGVEAADRIAKFVRGVHGTNGITAGRRSECEKENGLASSPTCEASC